ncbi:lytic murein transglycosylase [Pseudonocardia xishanensis]|uniref:Transglycosylase protein with SLT domain n=1 Tax=Pseudonocardia xishanensis TaxID=630995 RepID=A0ABP8S5Q9_9PSEU
MRPFAILLGVLTAVGLLVLGIAGLGTSEREPGRGPVARGTPATPAPAVPAEADPAAWAADRADAVGIPERVLAAYAAAELAQRTATPGCNLSWATLAGIGRIESDHARIHGSSLVDGVAQPAIVGIPLDGSSGTREIADTDGGTLDGDPTYDRAVGPMQFLPQTWERFGRGDPQDIDAAARAAAAYLCTADRDVADGAGWWDGVLAYNRSVAYAQRVWAAADRYASAASPA